MRTRGARRLMRELVRVRVRVRVRLMVRVRLLVRVARPCRRLLLPAR
ncbi:hypothetical protein [Streptomyces lunaelactis]